MPCHHNCSTALSNSARRIGRRRGQHMYHIYREKSQHKFKEQTGDFIWNVGCALVMYARIQYDVANELNMRNYYVGNRMYPCLSAGCPATGL